MAGGSNLSSLILLEDLVMLLADYCHQFFQSVDGQVNICLLRFGEVTELIAITINYSLI